MKDFITVTVLFLLMVSIICLNICFVKSTTEQMTKAIESLNPIPCENNAIILNEFNKAWKKNIIWFNLSVSYNDIQSITDTIDVLISTNQTGDLDQFQIHTKLMLNSIDELARLERFSAKNIL